MKYKATTQASLTRLQELQRGLGSATGPFAGNCLQAFLSEFETLQDAMRIPKANRSHRLGFTRNYQQLLPDTERRYRQDVLVAALEKPTPLFVNGTRFDADPDVPRSASALVCSWASVYHAAGNKEFGRTLMENFDADYSDFENKYVSFLIATEASCKKIVEYGSCLANRILGGENWHKEFVSVLQQLNGLANTTGKGRQDLHYCILEESRAMLDPAGVDSDSSGVDARLPRMCETVISVYDETIRYFAEVGQAMEKVDPHLARNPALVKTLAAWEEAWERAMPYMHSVSLRKTLVNFIQDLRAVSKQCPEFLEWCANSDVEAMLLLPQLFAAFCAHHGPAATEILCLAAETSHAEVHLPKQLPKEDYEEVIAKLAKGEVLTEYQACGMRIQRSRPAAWNTFLVAVIGELEEK
jgi:hypothetical protein